MMDIVCTKYFQKSKVFLYPLLKFRKGMHYTPANTYVCWNDVYTLRDYKFICVYNHKRNEKYKLFETKYIRNHTLFERSILGKNNQIYIFSFSPYKNEYKKFIKGRYSKFSKKAKDTIIKFFDRDVVASSHMNSYLNPSDHHNDYAEALDVDISLIKQVNELCDKPNMDKETLHERDFINLS